MFLSRRAFVLLGAVPVALAWLLEAIGVAGWARVLVMGCGIGAVAAWARWCDNVAQVRAALLAEMPTSHRRSRW